MKKWWRHTETFPHVILKKLSQKYTTDFIGYLHENILVYKQALDFKLMIYFDL